MHSGRHYTLKEVAAWTRRETAIFLLIAITPTALYVLAGWTWLTIPWLPIAMVGTAVAFITGFKNNASYGRLWEARQVWGSIVNVSRAWAMMARDFPVDADDAVKRRLIDRHVAWLTALRYQLRERRPWENMECRHNVEYRKNYVVEEWDGKLDERLTALLGGEEAAAIATRKNRASQILARQSSELAELAAAGHLGEYRFVEMSRTLAALVENQGKCERIKNFPYPRQFATLNLFFVWLFIVLVPFGLLQEFQKLGGALVWLTAPASVIVSWVFHTMDKIGESSENPFEGGPNDAPITAISRTIEIDLREIQGEPPPAPVQAVNQILM